MHMRYFFCLDPELTPVDDVNMDPLIIGSSVVYYLLDSYWWIFDNCSLIVFQVSCYIFSCISKEYLDFVKNTNMPLEKVILKKQAGSEAYKVLLAFSLLDSRILPRCKTVDGVF